ncbi:unnamed protein product, partial [Mesorhabditis spiculigera]
MKSRLTLLLTLPLFQTKIHFLEEFDDESWRDRWIQSQFPKNYGTWNLSSGVYHDDAARDQGIKTMTASFWKYNSSFYTISATFPRFSNRKTSLIVQFTVKHEQELDCGGGYIKIMPSTIDQHQFNDKTPYHVMFGPDICNSRKDLQVIINQHGRQYPLKEILRCAWDDLTHLYTLILNPNGTYEVRTDWLRMGTGYVEEDFDLDWDWVKSGSIFDNILITDDLEEARQHAKKTFEPLRRAERTQRDEAFKKFRTERHEEIRQQGGEVKRRGWAQKAKRHGEEL